MNEYFRFEILRIYTTLLVLFILPSVSILMAQQPYMRNITDSDGLPSLTVYDLFQDNRDYIWVGTDKGLCRYDGQQFKYYYNQFQKGTAIDGLKEDSQGHIWCKNFSNQVFYLDGDSLHLLDLGANLNGIGRIEQIDIDKNDKVWIGTTYKILSYDIKTKKLTTVPVAQFKAVRKGHFGLSFLAVDHENQIWAGPLNEPIRKYSQEVGFIPLQHAKKSMVLNVSAQIMDYCPLKAFVLTNGEVFFVEYCLEYGKLENKILHYHNDTIITIEKLSPYLKDQQVIAVSSNKKGQLLVNTYKGVFLFNSDMTAPKLFLKDIAVSKVLEDREGNYWFSTLSMGLYFMPSTQVDIHKIEGAADLGLERLAAIDSTHLVLGYSEAEHPLYRVTDHKVVLRYNTGEKRNIEALFFDKTAQRVFIQQGPTYVFERQGMQPVLKDVSQSNIKDITYLDNDFLLLGTRSDARVVRKDFEAIDSTIALTIGKGGQENMLFNSNSNFIRFAYPKDLNNNCAAVYAESFGKYWLGFSDTLRIFDYGKVRPVFDSSGSNVIAKAIISTEDNIIWVGSIAKGLLGYKDEKLCYHFTKVNGLVSNNVICLYAAENGLWIGTEKGLQYLDATYTKFKTYNKADGLISNEINDIELLAGKVWLVTPKGLISFDKNMPSTNNYPPPIYLSGIAINGVDTLLATKYELPYHRNNFFIRFQGIAYRSQGNFTYKYRMQGLSEDWVTVNSAQNELRFMSLNPGEYHLEIYALNEDGVESKKPIIIDFLIHPPYWQTWWFWSLIGGGLLLIAGGITYWQFTVYRRRQALILQMQQLRTQALQSQMNPHFIFNAMNAIQKLMVKDTMENALGYMAKFAKLIRMIFEISGQQSIPLEEEISFLKLYLDLEKLRFKDKVTIEFQIDEALLDDFYFIPPLLIQPIIENSFKHGLMHKETPGYLKIEFKKENGYLYVCVEDNGVGRKRAAELSEWKQEKRTKTGLIVTKERLSMLTAHPNHPQNFLITDLSDENGLAVGLRTELWISFSLENGDNES